MSVKLIPSDAKIWDKEKFIFDLLNDNPNKKLIVDLCLEGPDCQSAGIDAIIDQLVSDGKINGSMVVIYTSNQLPSSKYLEKRKSFAELSYAQKLAKNVSISHKLPALRFGMFTGRSNWLRLGLASYIWKYFRDTACMTFHYSPDNEYHRVNFGLEEFLSRHWQDRQQVFDFVDCLPIKFDQQTYPIQWNEQAFNLQEQYTKFFCEIVCETFFTNRTFMITEKTFRPIINRKPFLIQGPKWYLKNLKLLGFKTFDQWWDESYDQDPCDSRYTGLQWNINYIGQQSKETIAQWHKQMEPILEHNYNTLMNLTDQQITSTNFFYEE